MTKENPNNGNETKSNFISWGISKSDAIPFYQIILKYFNEFESETKADIFLWDIFKLDIIFH